MIGRHKPTLVQDLNQKWFGRCNCGASSGPNHYLNRWQADDWIVQHEEQVARAMANLGRGGGTLINDRNHAKRMYEDPATPEKDRAVWKILLDGFDQRLNDTVAPEQEKLW